MSVRSLDRTSADSKSQDTVGAIIIGGDYRALGVVRSLGRRGVPVCVIADDHSLASYSRFVSGKWSWPNEDFESSRLEVMDELADRCPGWVVFVTSDENAAFLERHRERLRDRLRLTTAPWPIMRWAYDKRLTHRLATDLGVRQPWTVCPRSEDEISSLDCPFPVVLKPAVKTATNRFTRDKAWRADDRRSLLALYQDACNLVDPEVIIVQELIPNARGSQVAFAALCQSGRVLASMMARTVRQYPTDFGHFSTWVETVEQPDVEDVGRKLLQAIDYTGLAQIQFKWDCRDRQYKLLEINPRVWGSHSLGQRAGVDFPYLLWEMVQGQLPPETRARIGVHWIRTLPNLLAFVEEVKRGVASPKRIHKLGAGAIFAYDDPLPGLMEVPQMLKLMWRRRGD